MSEQPPRSDQPPSIENAQVAWLFREMAELLELEGGANRFRIRAYRTAARTIEHHLESVVSLVQQQGPKALTALPGIGADLAARIGEIAETGTFAALEALRAKVPKGARELTRLRGLGGKRARVLESTLGVSSLDELQRALDSGKVRSVPGFGVGMESKLRQEVERSRADQQRFRRSIATEYADAVTAYLRSGDDADQVEVVGSHRRRKDTVGNLNMIASSSRPEALLDRLTRYPGVTEVVHREGARARVRLRPGLEVDLMIVDRASWGAALLYYTGSETHLAGLGERAGKHGLTLKEEGLFRGTRRVAGDTEAEMFAALALVEIPPELREGRGEIEAAASGRLPRLIELSDIRGDLQSHTTDSDGRFDLVTMVNAAARKGYEYFAITDHSPALRMVEGLDAEGFRRQGERIDELNRQLSGFVILKAAEVDILVDGSLDLDDATLDSLDLVVASVHSRFDLPESAQTDRLVRALSHPSVDILGHPTGRIIGRRPGMRYDLDAVLDAAASNGVMVEVNAQPDRLDFDDVAARKALDRGMKIVISTDAHRVSELDFMRWGIDQARRAGASAGDVANTFPLVELRKLLHRERRK